MSEKNLWFGFLEAGEKSSPVLIDASLNTANPQTVYVFNYNRGEIIEYRRDIIEAKLRQLETNDGVDEKKLKTSYSQARNGFVPRGGKVSAIPEKAAPKQAAKKPVATVDEGDEDMDPFIGETVTADDDEDWGDD